MGEFVEDCITRLIRGGLSGGFVTVTESEGGKWDNLTVSFKREIDGEEERAKVGNSVASDKDDEGQDTIFRHPAVVVS